jgi:N-acetylmuramoyl-L-alanine amidase
MRPAAAATPARTMYANALSREQVVRESLAEPDASSTLLVEIRSIVHAYELLVAHYPASGYSDNALWQAGRLELDAFEKFGHQRDREIGVRLLRQLQASYVASKLARHVPEQLARVQGPAATSGNLPAPTVRSQSAPPPAAPAQGVATTSAPSANVHTSTPDAPRTDAKIATIRDIRRALLPDAVRVTIELDSEVSFHDERIPDPTRVFLDLPMTRAVPALVDRTLRFDNDLVRQIRIGRHPNNTTRVVLDGAGISSYSVYPLYDPFRLVIDCVRAKPAAAPAPVAKPLLPSRALATTLVRRAPGGSPRASALISDAYASAAAAPPPSIEALPPRIPDLAPVAPVTPLPPPAIAPNKIGGGFSIARQLGLGVSRIVIDAGHGGHDPGAKGKGVTEAELVLDVALRVEKLLQKAGGTEVILTRRTDEFVTLQERTAIANREGADLFLSIHANASPSAEARGVETYFLNFANNLSAAAVAARENAASGQAMGALPDIVKAIALNNKLDESRDFARQVQHSMIERLRGGNKTVKDLGVKQAPFVVLIGAAMPSVLAEISFITNAQEARLLKGNPYRQRIAQALFEAIQKYQTSLRTQTTAVAHQD